MAHRFLYEYKLRWLPIDIKEVAITNWQFKWAHVHAEELGLTNDYVCRHVLQSYDGATFYDLKTKQYLIILNLFNEDGAERLPERITWTCAHEIGHIYLGHFELNGVECLAKKKISPELYEHLEFEADMFAGEVLASKWLMRDIDVKDENQIAMLCGISDSAALARYRKATADYSFVPTNVIVTRQNFSEYMKEITLCGTLQNFADMDIGDVSSFARLNKPKVFLPTPKPKFLRRPGNCPYCDGEYEAAYNPNFCIYCGKALKKELAASAEPCGKVNHKEAAYCCRCGHRVYRIRQGFCFNEYEL
jgi:Zn-dependent peptidase ImmA (M78 family)